MAYLDLTVAPTSILADSSAIAAGYPLGTDGAPTYTCTATVDAGTPQVIHDDDINGWGGASVGDCIVWDSGGVKEWRIVDDVSDIANHNIHVNAACTAGASKSAIVGGAVRHPHTMLDLVGGHGYSGWPSSLWDAPRVLVRNATYAMTEEINSSVLGTWSLNIPLQVIGCDTSGNVLDWRTTTQRALLDWGTSTVQCFNLGGAYVSFDNFILKLSQTVGNYAINYQSSVDFRNCVLWQVAHIYYVCYRCRGIFMRCQFRRDVPSTTYIVRAYTASVLDGCEIVGGGAGDSAVGLMAESQSTHRRVLVRNCGYGIRIGGAAPVNLIECSAIGNIADGFQFPTDVAFTGEIRGCLAAYNGGYGMARDGISGTYRPGNIRGNYFYGNTSGSFDAGIIPLGENVTLGTDPLENYAGGDYRIKPASDAYGVRHDLPSGLDADASFLDAGAIQRLRSASSGGGRRSRARVLA